MTNALPVPEQWLSPAFIAEHDVTWRGLSLGLVLVSCPGCVLSGPHLPCSRGKTVDAVVALFSGS